MNKSHAAPCRKAFARFLSDSGRLLLAALLCAAALPATAQRVLFDARHAETAGNADWIVDADTSVNYYLTYLCQPGGNHHSGQRYPTPAQAGITLATPETFWSGGISAWGVALAKDALDPGRNRTWTIEQYAYDAPPMTYGDGGNPQDLSNYDVLIIDEPNIPFTAGEITAIRTFVFNGGGLFLIADHETSDRDCDAGSGNDPNDSPKILNQLMGVNVAFQPTVPYWTPTSTSNTFGVFGIWFYENGNDTSGDATNKAFDWFDEGVNSNTNTDPADPIIFGPFGNGSGGLGLFGSTQMALSRHATRGNPTVQAHVWRNSATETWNAADVMENVTFASATYGSGRVVAVGDSSPSDDGTGEGTLYPGWDKAVGGVANHIIHLNATEWLANPTPDTDPPVIEPGIAATPADCSAVITWTTDENATSVVDHGQTPALGSNASVAGYTKTHAVTLTGLTAGTLYYYRVSSTDQAGNGPTQSAVLSFTTGGATALSISGGPTVSNITSNSAEIAWNTNKAATTVVRYGTTLALGSTSSDATPVTGHARILTGLAPSQLYYYEVESVDGCGNVVTSTPDSFTTDVQPPVLDISGWRLLNNNAAFEYTFPPGTEIPANGYIVVGRFNDQASFEIEWGTLPPGTVYLNSNDEILINSTARPYRIEDDTAAVVDGPTVTIAANQSKARLDNCGDPGLAGTWSTRAATLGDPGQGAPANCGAGVVISEMTDGADYQNEFVEVYYDATPAAPDNTPPVISSEGAAAGDCSLTFTWTTDEPADSLVEYGLAAYGEQSTSNATLVTSHSVTVNGLTPGTLYFWRVGSSDGSGNGPAWSAGSSTSTSSNAPGLSAITASPVLATSATVTWTTNETATRTVEYGTTVAYGTSAGTGSGTNHSVNLTPLAPSTLYHYRVRSTDTCGLESVSSDFTFTTAAADVTPPAEITDLDATPLVNGAIRLTWTAPGDDGMTGTATSYEVRRSATPIRNEAEWAAATVVASPPVPSAAGTPEQFDVTGLAAGSGWFFGVRASDEVPNQGVVGNTAGARVASGGSAANHLVISEIQTGSGTSADDEFIELYNPTASAVSVNGWSIQYKSATGSTYLKDNLSNVSIPAGGHMLLARTLYDGTPARDFTVASFLMSGTGGNVYLVNNTTLLTSCNQASVVDRVAYGTGNCPETTAIAAPASGASIERKPGTPNGNGTDTDNNSADFSQLATPIPQNLSSAVEPPPSTLGIVGDTLYATGPTGWKWIKVYAATLYRVRRGTTPDFMLTPPAPFATPSSNGWSDTDVPAADGCYYYDVRAFDGSTESSN